MKKKIILIATTLCFLLAMLVGCSNEHSDSNNTHLLHGATPHGSYSNITPNSEWTLTDGMAFRLYQDRQPLGTSGVTIIMENNSEYVMLYGYGFVWEQYLNGEWLQLAHRKDVAYASVGMLLNDQEVKTFFASTFSLQEPLSEGLYRISRWNPIRIALDDLNLGWDGNFIELPTYKLEFVVCHTASNEPSSIVLERQYWEWYSSSDWYDDMRNEHVMWFANGANEGRNLVGILYTDCRDFSWYGHLETGSLLMRIFDRKTGITHDVFEQPPVRPDEFSAYEYEGLHGFKLCFGEYQLFATLSSDGLPIYFAMGQNGQNTTLATHTASHISDDFILSIFSDKEVYSTADSIQVWATLEYIGDYDEITIWHSLPAIIFTITDGNAFNMDGLVADVLEKTILQRGEVYRFEFQKSGGWSADDPDADFWQRFFLEEDLRLPAGEYAITVIGGFSLTERMMDSPSGLRAELNIRIVEVNSYPRHDANNSQSDSSYEVGRVWLVADGKEHEPGEHLLHGATNTENGLISGTGIPFEFWLESNWSNLPIIPFATDMRIMIEGNNGRIVTFTQDYPAYHEEYRQIGISAVNFIDGSAAIALPFNSGAYLVYTDVHWSGGGDEFTLIRYVFKIVREFELEDIPEHSPQLFVSITANGLPIQGFSAAQGTTSWSPPVAFMDRWQIGDTISDIGYEASGEHPLDFWRRTWDCIDFDTFQADLYGVDGEIIIRLESDFRPTLLYVKRWNVNYIGMSSEMWNAYESIEVTGNLFRIHNNGNDYIYEIVASWARGEHQFGRASYTFRLNSDR